MTWGSTPGDGCVRLPRGDCSDAPGTLSTRESAHHLDPCASGGRRSLARVPASVRRADAPARPARGAAARRGSANRDRRLAAAPLDLAPTSELEFEDLAGLFASSILNHGVIGMTIRQAAYVFGVTRRTGAKKAIEIGRWRGGSTIILAAAMGDGGKVWSIDIGEKASGARRGRRALDDETRAFCERFGLDVELVVGDSRTLELDTGEVDVVLIDGEHTYEGTRIDAERWGRKLRVGGALLVDDASDDYFVPGHKDTAGRVVSELQAEGDFRLVKAVDRLAHLERVR